MDITTIIQALIALAVAVITGVLIPIIRAKTTKEQRDQIESWVKIAVAAAEQIYKQFDKAGKDKKEYVQEFLAAQGVTYDEEAIDAMIEAAVLELGKQNE